MPVEYIMFFIDETLQEEESDTTRKEGHEMSTDERRLAGRWDRMEKEEKHRVYSAAVIDGSKRTSTIFVGDSMCRKTESRLHKDEDIVVCSP